MEVNIIRFAYFFRGGVFCVCLCVCVCVCVCVCESLISPDSMNSLAVAHSNINSLRIYIFTHLNII